MREHENKIQAAWEAYHGPPVNDGLGDPYIPAAPPAFMRGFVDGYEAGKGDAPQWQDISSIPRDENVWIFCRSTGLMCISNHDEVVVSGEYQEATDWQVLPDPPEG